MADEITPLITKEDIQDLVIQKKFVRIDSNNYTEEAYEYIKQLINDEHAILFDRSTHRIWTLGEWFGGDVFKENLYYYSKIKVIDLDNELLSEIESIKPESTLAFRGKTNININSSHDEENDQDVIDIDLDIYNLIKNQPNNKYSLFIDEDGKIGIKEYIEPSIEIIKQDHIPNKDNVEIEFIVESSIPIENWNKFEVKTKNCELESIDFENRKLKINIDPNNYPAGIKESIDISYDDGYTSNTIYINEIFNIYCYFGCYDPDTFEYIELGSYIIENGNIEQVFKINQADKYYAYYRCPYKYNLLFIDNRRYMQGAWKEETSVTVNEMQYKTYITINPGLGNIEWKVLENIN